MSPAKIEWNIAELPEQSGELSGCEWTHVCQSRTWRVQPRHLNHHDNIFRFNIDTRTVLLAPSAKERQVMEYMERNPRNDVADAAMLITDVDAFLARIMDSAAAANPTGTPKKCTLAEFWAVMEAQNKAEKEKQAKEQARHEQGVTSGESLLRELQAAGQGNTDVANSVRAELRTARAAVTACKTKLQHCAANDQFLAGVKARIEEAIVNACPICIDTIPGGKVTITPCQHVFCSDCITSWLGQHTMCPMCRFTPVTAASLKVISCDDGAAPAAENAQPESGQASTKVNFLLGFLRRLFVETDDKVIIFCRWNETLRRVQDILQGEGIQCARMDGNVYGKSKHLKAFKLQANVRVMLLNTLKHNCGMDLIEANHIIFLDTKSVTAEALIQSYGRCARIGQTKPIRVTILAMQNMEPTSAIAECLQRLKESSNNIQAINSTTIRPSAGAQPLNV